MKETAGQSAGQFGGGDYPDSTRPSTERSNAPFSLMWIPGVFASASVWPHRGGWALKSKALF